MSDASLQLRTKQRPAGQQRLRAPLALALGLLLAAMLANFGYTVWADRDDRIHEAEKTTQNLAHVIEEQTASMVDAAAFSLSSAARRIQRIPPPERTGTAAAQDVLRDNLRAMPFARALFIVDSTGRLLYDSETYPPTAESYVQSAFFRAHRDAPQGGLFIGPAEAGPLSHDGLVIISRRLEDEEGSFAGVAAVGIDPQYLKSVYLKVDVGRTGSIALFMRDGRLLARSAPFAAGVRTESANTELFKELLPRSPTGTYISRTALDNVPRIVSYRAMSSHPLLVAVGLGQDEVLASWVSKAWVFASIALALAAVIARLSFVVFRELARRDEAQRALRASELELRISAIAFQTQEMIMITSADRRIVRVNDALLRATGHTMDELAGQHVSIVFARTTEQDQAFLDKMSQTIAEDNRWQGEILCCRKNGEQFPVRMTVTTVLDPAGKVTHRVGVLSDITKDKESEQSIHRLAFYDPLTQLPNRSLLRDRLQQALARSGRDEHHGALLFLDLDHFKVLNDTRGHNVGDTLLVEVAKRLRGCVRLSDTVARLGGDEFVVLLANLSPDAQQAALEAQDLGRKVLTALNQPFTLPGLTHHGSASIGVALFSNDSIGVDDLLQQSDLAMYQAKASGRNALRFFDVGMQQALQSRVELEADLRTGLARQELLLHYQPVVQGTSTVTGAEALVRWQHPVRGLVSPCEFIPLAEATGLIVPLGQWVLVTACTQLAAWATQPALARLTMAVNVSAHQFREADFVAKVMQAVQETGADPQRLKLELTESVLAHDVEDVIVKMEALRAHGVSFSLDDFGTGYSSLSYLKRLPLSQLKIDKSFVRDVLVDANDAAIARTIVLLSQSLQLDVVAEGVETEGQRRFLADNGCDVYQGYLFGKPMPVAAFEEFAAGRVAA